MQFWFLKMMATTKVSFEYANCLFSLLKSHLMVGASERVGCQSVKTPTTCYGCSCSQHMTHSICSHSARCLCLCVCVNVCVCVCVSIILPLNRHLNCHGRITCCSCTCVMLMNTRASKAGSSAPQLVEENIGCLMDSALRSKRDAQQRVASFAALSATGRIHQCALYKIWVLMYFFLLWPQRAAKAVCACCRFHLSQLWSCV